jgi:hypothetical protein
MGETPGPQYRPLWLTAEEHQSLFGELLQAPEGFKAERLADLLKRADARAQDWNVQLSTKEGGAVFDAKSTTRSVAPLAGPALAGARRAFRTMLLAMAFLALAAVLYSIFSRR